MLMNDNQLVKLLFSQLTTNMNIFEILHQQMRRNRPRISQLSVEIQIPIEESQPGWQLIVSHCSNTSVFSTSNQISTILGPCQISVVAAP